MPAKKTAAKIVKKTTRAVKKTTKSKKPIKKNESKNDSDNESKINEEINEEGNEQKKSKGGGQIVGWDLRLNQNRSNGDKWSKDDVGQCLIKLCKQFAFQLERGNENGLMHYQIHCALIKKSIKSTLLDNLCKALNCEKCDAPQHIAPLSKEAYKQAKFSYVMKEDTRVEGPWTDKDFINEKLIEPVFIPPQYNIPMEDFMPFQKSIWDSTLFTEEMKTDYRKLDTRGTNLLVHPKGDSGKSTIAAICELKGNGLILPTVTDAKQLIEAACDMCIAKHQRYPAFFIDLPRAMFETLTRKQLCEIFSAIESLKNGKLFDLRNKYKDWWIASPCIWVYCNELPDLRLLTRDRWRIWKINENKELVKMPDDEIDEEMHNKKYDVVVTSDGLKPEKEYKKKKTKKDIKNDDIDDSDEDDESLEIMFEMLLKKMKKKKHKNDTESDIESDTETNKLSKIKKRLF